MFGLKRPYYRASAILGCLLVFNILTIFELLGLSLAKKIIPLILILGIIVTMIYFIRPTKHKEVLSCFFRESLKQRQIGMLVSLLYFVLTIVVFVRIR